jgi:hypothetical protein
MFKYGTGKFQCTAGNASSSSLPFLIARPDSGEM